MRIAFLASEVVPFAKTGGLADVVGALPPVLAELGHECAVFMPKYRMVKQGQHALEETGVKLNIPVGTQNFAVQVEKSFLPGGKVPIYLIVQDQLYDRPGSEENGQEYPDNLERFTVYCRAVLEFMKAEGWKPDVIQCNDWQTGLIPIYLKTLYAKDHFFSGIRTLYTIHNLAYQGIFSRDKLPLTGLGWDLFRLDGLEFYSGVSLTKGALMFADKISTVSEKYAQEIQTPEFGCRLEGVLQMRSHDLVVGILNGVDYSEWSPDTDQFIPGKYSLSSLAGKNKIKLALQKRSGLPEDAKIPLIGVISRLADQKGFDILSEMVEYMLGMDAQLVLLGTGSPNYHRIFTELGEKYPDQAKINLSFNNELAHCIYAGSDLFLMPSRYEPCGLSQMYCLRYGTIPVVRKTGGLADTIQDYDPHTKTGTGFVFTDPTPKALYFAVKRGIDLYRKNKPQWKELVKRAMQQDFSWQVSALKYEALFKKMAHS